MGEQGASVQKETAKQKGNELEEVAVYDADGGVQKCDRSFWHNVHERCEPCTAVIHGWNLSLSCEDYCHEEGMECESAWEPVKDTCEKGREFSCSRRDLRDESTMPLSKVICNC